MAASGETQAREQEGATELNLGVKLRRARESQALSFDDVAGELRISQAALRALEECRFDAVGPPVFAKGYLRQYAALLGLDVGDIIAEYERAVGNERFDIAPTRSIKLRDDRQVTVWVVAAVMLVVLAALLLVWWFRQPGQLWGPPEAGSAAETTSLRSTTIPATPRSAEPDRVATSVPVTSTIEPAPIETDPVAADEPAVAAVPESTIDEPVPERAIEPVPERAIEPVPERAIEPDSRRAPALASEPTVEPTTSEVEPDTVANAPAEPSVEVLFVEDSWAEITAGSGDKLFYRLGKAGTTAQFPLEDGIRFFFGNAGGVRIRVDGEPVAIPSSARRGDLAQFDLGDLLD